MPTGHRLSQASTGSAQRNGDGTQTQPEGSATQRAADVPDGAGPGPCALMSLTAVVAY